MTCSADRPRPPWGGPIIGGVRRIRFLPGPSMTMHAWLAGVDPRGSGRRQTDLFTMLRRCHPHSPVEAVLVLRRASQSQLAGRAPRLFTLETDEGRPGDAVSTTKPGQSTKTGISPKTPPQRILSPRPDSRRKTLLRRGRRWVSPERVTTMAWRHPEQRDPSGRLLSAPRANEGEVSRRPRAGTCVHHPAVPGREGSRRAPVDRSRPREHLI